MIQQLVMYEEELSQINNICEILHRDANARAVLVIDKNGQAFAQAGEVEQLAVDLGDDGRVREARADRLRDINRPCLCRDRLFTPVGQSNLDVAHRGIFSVTRGKRTCPNGEDGKRRARAIIKGRPSWR